jgi:hypothetical protein
MANLPVICAVPKFYDDCRVYACDKIGGAFWFRTNYLIDARTAFIDGHD